MGTFLANVHVRTEDSERVHKVLADLGADARVTAPRDSWITVYEARASTQDADWIETLCCALSKGTGAPTVAFMLHDSDVLYGWVAELGRIETRLDTWPGFPDAEPKPRISNPDALLALCPALNDFALRRLVNTDTTFADSILEDLAEHLGISPVHALSDYRDDPKASDPWSDGLLDEMAAKLAKMAGPVTGHNDSATQLVEAAHRGDLPAMSELLDAGVPPEAVGPWRPSKGRTGQTANLFPEFAVTPLYAAAAEGQVEAIELLVERGADPNHAIPQGDIPLSAAACAGQPAAVKALLACGADPTARRVEGATAADMVDATLQQVAALRGAIGQILTFPGLDKHFPDEDALRACAALLGSTEE